MEHHTTTTRAEAERLLGIAEKLLSTKDFAGCRYFAILAQETEPLLEGSDQILAIAEVLIADDRKKLGNRPDWYAVLQIPTRTDDAELIKKQYRRLALLLHPDKNKFPFSDSAFRLVADSWAVLSDPVKKSEYDRELASRFTKVDLVALKKQQQKFNQQMKQHQMKAEGDSQQKLPVRRSSRGQGGENDGDGDVKSTGTRGQKKSTELGVNFWTACPYCYNLYEYQRIYESCCLRCQNCKRAFTATEVLSMPPLVPGKEAYYCCWGFFPMSFTAGNVGGGGNVFPKWMPPIYSSVPPANTEAEPEPPRNVTPVSAAVPAASPATTGKKKRGRPRKNR